MMKGLPGSGKSTYARKLVHDNPTKTIRVNKDDLRAMMHDGVWKGNATENQIVVVRDFIVLQGLESGRDVIVDDTNLAPVHERVLRMIAEEAGARFEVVDFTGVPLKECLANDLKRTASVGHKVIQKMYYQYLAQKWAPPVYDVDKRDCIIVDIDGTLAHMQDRGPYDFHMVHTDALDPVVFQLVHQQYELGVDIIVCSGRDDSCRDVTEAWLEDKCIEFTMLLMRKTGDKRDDGIVKRELYEEHIAPYFNVKFVLDDRDRVVDMWRSLGLKCLQVEAGDF